MKTTTTMDMQETLKLTGDQHIVVKEGILWVTYKGDSADYFYRAGETIHISKKKTAVIEAMSKSSFEILVAA